MSESLIGIMIGAAAAIFGGLLGEMLKYRLDIKRENRAAIRCAYESIEDTLMQLSSDHPGDIDACLTNVGGKIALYCRASIVDLWTEIVDIFCKPESERNLADLKIKSGKLLKLLRADLRLKIKD